jgi:hypothetical protein
MRLDLRERGLHPANRTWIPRLQLRCLLTAHGMLPSYHLFDAVLRGGKRVAPERCRIPPILASRRIRMLYAGPVSGSSHCRIKFLWRLDCPKVNTLTNFPQLRSFVALLREHAEIANVS